MFKEYKDSPVLITLIWASIASIIAAYATYQYVHGTWVILSSPQLELKVQNISENLPDRFAQIIYYKNDTHHTQTIRITPSPCITHTIHTVLNNWIQIVTTEKLLTITTHIQAVLCDQETKNWFISFDALPFTSTQSMYEKLNIIRGIIDTIAAYTQDINTITFLVNHSLAYDRDLDLSVSWHP
jgi:hypothetical protein